MEDLKNEFSNDIIKKNLHLFQVSDAGACIIYYASNKKKSWSLKIKEIIDPHKNISEKTPLCW